MTARDPHASCVKEAMSKVGDWIGPPPLSFSGATIDGRARTVAAVDLGIQIPAPVRCLSLSAAVAELIRRGHGDRAADLIVQRGITIADAAQMFALSAEQSAALVGHSKRSCRRRTNDGRKRRITRADVIRRCSQLWINAIEHDTPITAEQLEKALGQWLDRSARTNGRR